MINFWNLILLKLIVIHPAINVFLDFDTTTSIKFYGWFLQTPIYRISYKKNIYYRESKEYFNNV